MRTGIKRTLLGLGLTSTVGLAGCVVSVGSRVQAPPTSTPPVVVVTDTAQAATITEIDAAAQLSMDSSRTHALTQIAERPNLSPPVQVYMINTTYRSLSMESSKVYALQKMIARPDFCDSARQAIVMQLSQLGMDSNRQTILNQINERLKQPSTQTQQ